MIHCADCGCNFFKPTLVVERHGLDTPPYEQYMGCPFCHSGDIFKAVYCDECNRLITGDCYKTIGGLYYCEHCAAAVDIRNESVED